MLPDLVTAAPLPNIRDAHTSIKLQSFLGDFYLRLQPTAAVASSRRRDRGGRIRAGPAEPGPRGTSRDEWPRRASWRCCSIETVAGERHVWNFAVGQTSSSVGIVAG